MRKMVIFCIFVVPMFFLKSLYSRCIQTVNKKMQTAIPVLAHGGNLLNCGICSTQYLKNLYTKDAFIKSKIIRINVPL